MWPSLSVGSPWPGTACCTGWGPSVGPGGSVTRWIGALWWSQKGDFNSAFVCQVGNKMERPWFPKSISSFSSYWVGLTFLVSKATKKLPSQRYCLAVRSGSEATLAGGAGSTDACSELADGLGTSRRLCQKHGVAAVQEHQRSWTSTGLTKCLVVGAVQTLRKFRNIYENLRTTCMEGLNSKLALVVGGLAVNSTVAHSGQARLVTGVSGRWAALHLSWTSGGAPGFENSYFVAFGTESLRIVLKCRCKYSILP